MWPCCCFFKCLQLADEELPYSYKNHNHNNNNDNDNKHAYAFNNTPARARVNSEQTKVMAEALHAPLPLMEAVFLCLILKKYI